MQGCSNSIASAMELLQCCTKLLTFGITRTHRAWIWSIKKIPFTVASTLHGWLQVQLVFKLNRISNYIHNLTKINLKHDIHWLMTEFKSNCFKQIFKIKNKKTHINWPKSHCTDNPSMNDIWEVYFESFEEMELHQNKHCKQNQFTFTDV